VNFRLLAPYPPRGDQPKAIQALVEGVRAGLEHQVLLGVTGSGKTFTMANVIAALGRPTLVISPNKTLAAQLYQEFRELFPHNAVEYFVSYYDYYQPEAYVPETDTYIAKDASIDDRIDRLRHSATRSILERRDVIVVASVSCIYGLGCPQTYEAMRLRLWEGMELDRQTLLARLAEMQYARNDLEPRRGNFRVCGSRVEVFPAHEEDRMLRLEFWGDTLEAIWELDPLGGHPQRRRRVSIYPASHYVVPPPQMDQALRSIEEELAERLAELRARGKPLEAQRLEHRTRYDLEMMRELGYCPGIENYSRHLEGRRPGEPPYTLLHYFPDDLLVFIDESHIAVPQLASMYRGDRARKETLVEYGFRLPSALDNRPLRFEEFEGMVGQRIYVSATPGDYELERSEGRVVEQIIRPTGLVDPKMVVRPARGQVDDLLLEARRRALRGERTLVTTLTKRTAEELADHYAEMGLRVRYLHSEVDTLERVEILRDLRQGKFDVLVGVNLLREGLDLPEVSLVAVLDADREGFLRSHRSLIQMAGRAARNAAGMVILYADQVTPAMQLALEETERRRRLQEEHNRRHGIRPRTVRKAIPASLLGAVERLEVPPADLPQAIRRLERRMREAARQLNFEDAAHLRDQLRQLQELQIRLGLLDTAQQGG